MIRSVLIVGGSGYIGTHLAQRLREGYKVFATYVTHPLAIPGVTSLPLAVDNRTWLKHVFGMARPDVIIYAAGEKKRAKPHDFHDLENIHAKGAANVLDCAEMLQPRFIYLSNSHVFDGERGNYHESDAALPYNLIGKAKVSAENFIKSRSFHSVVVRASPLFGRGNGFNFSFIDRMRMSLDRGKTYELNEQEIHSFAPVNGFVDFISELISKPAVRSRILHYGGLTKMSYADFGRAYAARFGFDPKLIISKPSADGETTDLSLNSSHAVEQLKIKPFLLEEGFDLIEKQLISRA